MEEIQKLQEALKHFAIERDWEQFHTPKNIAIALSIEASELLELFQWSTPEESFHPPRKELKEELSDVFLYLLRLSSILEVDLVKASWEKIEKNREKYPVHLAKGNSKKYNQLTESKE